MRIRLHTRPSVLFGGMLVVALLAFLPMRLALGWAGLGEEGFTARSVTGSIWDATIRDAQFGDLSLGTLDARLSPLSLLIGRARLHIDAGSNVSSDVSSDSGPPGALHGAITTSRNTRGIDGVSGNLPTGRVFAPLPVTQLTLDEVSVHFTGDSCDTASGRVTAALGGDVAGVPLPASVSGNATCQNGALVLPLASQSGNESVTLRVTATGTYTAMLALAPTDPVAAQKLAMLGFVQSANGYQLSIQGSF